MTDEELKEFAGYAYRYAKSFNEPSNKSDNSAQELVDFVNAMLAEREANGRT